MPYAVRRSVGSMVSLLAVVASCSSAVEPERPELGATAPAATCGACEPPEEGNPPPSFPACSTCGTLPCSAQCKTTPTATLTTCGAVGTCEACSDALCPAGAQCDVTCKSSVGVEPCSSWSQRVHGDADIDHIPDALEFELAKKFFPSINMHCGVYEGYANGSKGQFYGSDVGCGTLAGAAVPFVVRRIAPLANGWCSQFDCLEIIYGLPYASDLGDDTGFGEHVGDSEMYAVLLAYHIPGPGYEGAEFATAPNFATALTSASHWALVKEFATAHMCESSMWDSSGFRRPRYLSGSTLYEHSLMARQIFAAEGKNASYFSSEACNGDMFWPDDCSDSRCTLQPAVVWPKLRNVGDVVCHPSSGFNTKIPSAASWVGGCGVANAYDVWSNAAYGSAAPFASKFAASVIDWGNETWRCF